MICIGNRHKRFYHERNVYRNSSPRTHASIDRISYPNSLSSIYKTKHVRKILHLSQCLPFSCDL